MSLKRRNSIALMLIVLASVCWSLGSWILAGNASWGYMATTMPSMFGDESAAPSHVNTSIATTAYTDETQNGVTDTIHSTEHTDPYGAGEGTLSRLEKYFGYILCFVAVVAAAVAVFPLAQKNPFFGPDGICLFSGVAFLIYEGIGFTDYILWGRVYESISIVNTAVIVFLVLFFVRELWGWILARCSLSWCLLHRLSMVPKRPQISLLLVCGWITLSIFALGYLLFTLSLRYALFPVCCFMICALFGVLKLWQYGADLHHFKTQLDNYQKGLPVTVKEGAFAQTEAQLLDVQAQHEEAVRTAVTSERFKVELIANVSHDLRTPLTSILGYSELLQKESLSAEGTEQLQRLHQKAGYMNDLVESLFELTKVSSGVMESKKEKIDLVRLLEQTVGLFDDQLVSAGLTVRRNYCAESICVVTDGARMHQVFANLLGNAIKYALPGTRVYLEVRETEESLRIRMMNTASYEMDFAPEEILQRFARGDKARSTKGSGLGLAIAKTYTESVGGNFRVAVDGDQFSAIVELPKTERNL